VIKPLHDNVLVMLDPANHVLNGQGQAASEGVVVAVGNYCTTVQVGDRVIYRGSGTEVILDGKIHVLLPTGDIMGVVG
jgi:co-chaperonin GroES (HSP10)